MCSSDLTTRGEHHIAHTTVGCRLHEQRRTGDVVVPVAQGLLHRLADSLVRSEVDELRDLVLAAGAGDESQIGDVAHHQLSIDDGIGVTEFEGVEHHDVMASGDQLSDRVRADVASTPGDEHVHAQHPMGIGHTPRRCAVHYAHGVSSSPTAPFVRVVVINYDGGAVTRRCVDSLLATEYPADRLQVVVVDNASIDGLNWVLREQYPQVTLIESDVNEGFARGCNLGMRDLDGVDYVALINNDAIVPTNWLQPLLDAFAGGEKVGAVVPKLLLNVFAHAFFLDPERVDELSDGRRVGVSVNDLRVEIGRAHV